MVLEKTLESPLDCKEIQPVHPKGDSSGCSLEGLMLKLKLQYFVRLMLNTGMFSPRSHQPLEEQSPGTRLWKEAGRGLPGWSRCPARSGPHWPVHLHAQSPSSADVEGAPEMFVD